MTGRGWAVLSLSISLWVWARSLGIGELAQIALGLVVACVGALIWMRFRNRGLQVTRSFASSRVEKSEPVSMNMRIKHFDGKSTPPLTIAQPLPGSLGSFHTEIPPLLVGDHRLEQTVQFTKRGRYLLDHVVVTLTDPYGIARSKRKHHDPVSVLVYPRVDVLSTPDTALHAAQSESARRAPAPQGEDFYGVREYRVGDDPRRIHWPTSARLGTLMIREEEIAGRDRVTILLDDRSSAHNEETFEWSADAAASVMDLYMRMELMVRLVRPGSSDTPTARGVLQYERLMEELATAELQPAPEERLLALARRGQDDVLVMILGEIGAAVVAGLARVSGRYREVVTMFAPGLKGGLQFGNELGRAGIRLVQPRPGESLGQAWDTSLGRSSWTGETNPELVAP